MWQRIQTLFLLFAFLFNLLLLFVEIALLHAGSESYSYEITGILGLENQQAELSNYLLFSIALLSMILTAIVIFIYKRRQVQIKLAQLNLFIQLILVATIFYVTEEAVSLIPWDGEITIDYSIGTYLSLVPILMIYLAIRFIKKDEALIRAADRIR